MAAPFGPMAQALLGLSDLPPTPTPGPTPAPVPAPGPAFPHPELQGFMDYLPVIGDVGDQQNLQYNRPTGPLTWPENWRLAPPGDVPPSSEFQQNYVQRFERRYGERPTWDEIMYAWAEEWKDWLPSDTSGPLRRDEQNRPTGPLPPGYRRSLRDFRGRPVEI